MSKNTVPSLATFETVCNGFSITMSQFFAEGDAIELTPETKELFSYCRYLSPGQKVAAIQMLKAMSCGSQ